VPSQAGRRRKNSAGWLRRWADLSISWSDRANILPVPSPKAGFVGAIDNRALGIAVVALGGGRTRAADAIDHAVGLTGLAGLGARVSLGQPLAMVHARTAAAAEAAVEAIVAAYGLLDTAPVVGPLIAKRLQGAVA
jgi:thymidine phosphorylase